MKCPRLISRVLCTASVCAAVLALTTAASAAAPYTMLENNGFICIVNGATGELIYRSDVPADMLSQRDRLLLEAGIPLENQAEFTSALEDFCS